MVEITMATASNTKTSNTVKMKDMTTSKGKCLTRVASKRGFIYLDHILALKSLKRT